MSEPWYELLHHGPRVRVAVRLQPDDAEVIELAGGDPPSQPLVGMALIDTGANLTVVDDRVWKALKPTIHGETALKGFRDGTSSVVPRFHIELAFPGSDLPLWQGAVAGAPLASKTGSLVVLLARDFLRDHTLTYRGRDGTFALRHWSS